MIEQLRTHNIGYLVLTSEDAGFSSLSYLDYLLANPGFTLLHVEEADDLNRVYFFRVDRDRLQQLRPAVTMDQTTLAGLVTVRLSTFSGALII